MARARINAGNINVTAAITNGAVGDPKLKVGGETCAIIQAPDAI